MSTLVQYYQTHRAELQARCVGKTPNKAAGVLHAEFARLAALDGDYMQNLTVSQARVAVSLLDAFRFALTALWVEEIPQQTVDSWRAAPTDRPQLRHEGALAGAALGGTLVGTLVGGPIGGFAALAGTVVAGTAWGVIVGNVVQRLVSEPKEDSIHPPEPPIQINVDLLLASLEQSFAAIDQVVAQLPTGPAGVSPVSVIEDFPEMLEFMQDLLGDVQSDEPDAADQLRQSVLHIPAFLRQYGVKVETYQPADTAPDIQDHFEFEASLEPDRKTHFMLRPALLRDGRVLRRGRVVLPVE